MKFLLIGQIRADILAKGWPDDFDDLINGEQELAAKYYAAGIVERAWSMADRPGAAAIYNASSRQELDQLLAEYPLFKADYVEAQIIELKSYDGFEADRD